MKDYTPDRIRNIALAGHGGTGKTSLAEAMLFASGATTRLGKIDDGSTASDWDPDEQKRQFSLNVSTIPLEWKDHKANVVDTPGYMDFMGEVKCGLRAVETALITIDAVSGVQVGTEFAWRFADELELPRAIFINRMDRENADFDQAVRQIQDAFGAKCIPAQLPIGSQASLKGVVDVLTQKAYLGDKGEEAAIPDDMQAAADQAREKLIEAAAETAKGRFPEKPER
ncbi:MAG: GTP-binding protein, partial [Chloroflexota bacterium]